MEYLVSDYYATGEGRTVCILITPAFPKDGMSSKLVAAKEFLELFGNFYIRCAENLPKDIFFEKYGHYLPSFVLPIGDAHVHYSMKLHINYG